jgi:hypothetical protein
MQARALAAAVAATLLLAAPALRPASALAAKGNVDSGKVGAEGR